MLTFWILPLLLVGCSVPRSFPSPITSLSPVPVEKNPVHGAILSVESVDTSLFRAMNVRNNLDIVYNATDFGPYLAKRITLHLAQSGLFQQVLLDPKPGSVPHLSLGLEVEQLELINLSGSAGVAGTMRLMLQGMPQAEPVWTGQVKEEIAHQHVAGERIVPLDEALEDWAVRVAERVAEQLHYAAPKVKTALLAHPDLTRDWAPPVPTAATVDLPAAHPVTPSVEVPTASSPIMTQGLIPGKFHVLVIGNNDYRHLPRLLSARRDAEAVGKLLGSSYGFSVRVLTDATRAAILSAFNDYRKALQPEDSLLVYYAGHGWLDEQADEGYWLPVEAVMDNPVDWISNATITSAVKAIPARHVLVVADSCFSGKLTRGVRVTIRGSGYMERMASKRSRTVMTSGGMEPVLDVGGGDHSVFAKAFLGVLRENRVSVDTTTLFVAIRRQVMLAADQTPEYSDMRKAGHDGGDFLFVRQK